eukprot:COSAG05_NODE_398_length_10293_cov_11.919176_14_plen_127_part_00
MPCAHELVELVRCVSEKEEVCMRVCLKNEGTLQCCAPAPPLLLQQIYRAKTIASAYQWIGSALERCWTSDRSYSDLDNSTVGFIVSLLESSKSSVDVGFWIKHAPKFTHENTNTKPRGEPHWYTYG